MGSMRRYGCEWLWRLDNCGLCRHWLLPAGGQGSSGGGCRLPKPNIQSQTCSYCSHVTKPNSVMSATYRRLLKANITSLATQTEYITIGIYWFHRSQTQGKSAAYLTLFMIGRLLPRLRYYAKSSGLWAALPKYDSALKVRPNIYKLKRYTALRQSYQVLNVIKYIFCIFICIYFVCPVVSGVALMWLSCMFVWMSCSVCLCVLPFSAVEYVPSILA